jgi:hypothetical protein
MDDIYWMECGNEDRSVSCGNIRAGVRIKVFFKASTLLLYLS